MRRSWEMMDEERREHAGCSFPLQREYFDGKEEWWDGTHKLGIVKDGDREKARASGLRGESWLRGG